MNTARERILCRLREAGSALAVHELGFEDISENAAATRLSELAKDGLVVGWNRSGKRFKEWMALPQVGAV